MNATLTKRAGGLTPRATKTKVMETHKAAKTKAVAETIESLAGQLADAEAKIVAVDQRLAQAEAIYVESIAPILAERAAAECAYSRSKAAQTFLSSGVMDERDVWEQAGRRHADAVAALEAAEVELAHCPCPSGDRQRLILDRDKWTKVQAHERAREAQLAAERELNEAETQCRSLGVPVDVSTDLDAATEFPGIARRRRSTVLETV